MIQRFGGICLITSDVLTLCAFYEAALGLVPVACDATFAEFRIGDISLAIFSREGMEELAPGSMENAGTGRFTFDMEVDDPDQAFERVRALGAPIVKLPLTHPWGRRSFWFRDPDGNLVNLFRETVPTRKALVAEYFDRLFRRRDLSVIDERLAADYRDHDSPPDTPRGPAPIRTFVERMLSDHPDLAVKVLDLLQDGDQVAARILWRGTHAETGEVMNQMGNIIITFNGENQFVERWSAYREAETGTP